MYKNPHTHLIMFQRVNVKLDGLVFWEVGVDLYCGFFMHSVTLSNTGSLGIQINYHVSCIHSSIRASKGNQHLLATKYLPNKQNCHLRLIWSFIMLFCPGHTIIVFSDAP